MATRRTTTARRPSATALDFRAIVGDDNEVSGVQTDDDFPGCCGITVLNEFPYDNDLSEPTPASKQEAQSYIANGNSGKVALATVDVQTQSKAHGALLALGFTEITRFPGEVRGHHIALLMKKNGR